MNRGPKPIKTKQSIIDSIDPYENYTVEYAAKLIGMKTNTLNKRLSRGKHPIIQQPVSITGETLLRVLIPDYDDPARED